MVVPWISLLSVPNAAGVGHLRQRLWCLAAAVFILVTIRLLTGWRRRPSPRVVRLGGLTWTRSQFCRGWLITGDTGSGKTSSGINQLAHEVFANEPSWGGLLIDEKGSYVETFMAIARHHGRERDLVHLRVGEGGSEGPSFNLTGDRRIPFTTYAKFVTDAATSLGQAGDKGFFKTQAQTHIGIALELLYETRLPVTLKGAYDVLLNDAVLKNTLEDLSELTRTPGRQALLDHFENRYQNQPRDQLGGVKETIGNYLQSYLSPEVAEVFCVGGSTFDLDSIDQGKIVLVSMPQRLLTERRYINTFLKLLFYNHVLRRFDKSRGDRAKDNLLILWADEAQRFMTASEDGTSDYNCVDVIREANATIIAATQSTTSFLPPLGSDKAKVLVLNLRNRLLFRAADEQDALQSADFLGKRHVVRKQWGFTGGKSTVTYSVTEEHRVKPHELRRLRDHECLLVHCERGFRKAILPPLMANGGVAPWFSWWRRWSGFFGR